MAREPRQKGTSFLPVVLSLKVHPDRRRHVPERLWKYFDERILVSGWYPERDYFVLVEALVNTMDPEAFGGDVWRFFAKFSAQQDIGGVEVLPGDGANSVPKGVYRNFASVDAKDVDAFFRRAVRLWRQYHDSGEMEVAGRHPRTNGLVMRLVGFHIPLEGFVRLQGYYLEEYGKLVGLNLETRVLSSTARGDSLCEWEIILERNPSTEAYLASLPELR